MSPTRLIALLPVLIVACSSNGPDTSSAAKTDASTDATETADGGPDGRYHQGVYTCCAKGEERTCCPPETLPDPSVGRSATCFQYGGVTGDCTHAGNSYSARDICSKCCDGLKRLEAVAPLEDGTCEENAPPGIFFCGACGNGTCEEGAKGENKCNCPEDCK